MATNFEKLKSFKGKIATKWMVPDTFRRWACGANKLLKLHYRLVNTGLLWPDLVRQLQAAVAVWEAIGASKYHSKINTQYFVEFEEVRKFNITQFIVFQKNIASLLGNDKVETYVEETREHKDGLQCHFCRSRLVYPAYVVHRLAGEEIQRSESIGIMCLHHIHGKLQKLMEKAELQAILESIKKMEVTA